MCCGLLAKWLWVRVRVRAGAWEYTRCSFFFFFSGLISVVNTFVFVGSVVSVRDRLLIVSNRVICNFRTSTWVNVVTPMVYLSFTWLWLSPHICTSTWVARMIDISNSYLHVQIMPGWIFSYLFESKNKQAPTALVTARHICSVTFPACGQRVHPPFLVEIQRPSWSTTCKGVQQYSIHV